MTLSEKAIHFITKEYDIVSVHGKDTISFLTTADDKIEFSVAQSADDSVTLHATVRGIAVTHYEYTGFFIRSWDGMCGHLKSMQEFIKLMETR